MSEDKKTIVIDKKRSGMNMYIHLEDGGHWSHHLNENTNSGPVYGEKYPDLGSYQRTYDKDGRLIEETFRDEKGNLISQKTG